MKLFLQVTNDKYELPVVVADSVVQMAKINKCSPSLVYNDISNPPKTTKYKYVKVEVKEDD